jgi:hypothetical protein
LGLCGAFSIDREQDSQTQEVSNESWPIRPMIASESHVHLPQRQALFGAALTQNISAFCARNDYELNNMCNFSVLRRIR